MKEGQDRGILPERGGRTAEEAAAESCASLKPLHLTQTSLGLHPRRPANRGTLSRSLSKEALVAGPAL